MKLSKEDIKKELLNNLVHKDYYQLVKEELDELENCFGVDNENSLEILYDLWKIKGDEVGNENKSNSIAAWALGITSVKPSTIGIINRSIYARSGFPDIDMDFDASRRHEVFEEVEKGIGSDKFAHIGTEQTVQMRTAVTLLAKAFDIAGAYNKSKEEYVSENNRYVRHILDQLPDTKGKMKGKRVVEKNGQKVEETIEIKTVEDAYSCFKNFAYYLDKHPQIKKYAPYIEGMVRGRSIHAAGVVLSPYPLNLIAPLFKSNQDWGTQYVADDLESMGLIKFDFLGLAALTTIDQTIKLIKQRYDINIDMNKIEANDDKVFELYRSGNLDGVFQCEESGMQDTIRNIAPTNFSHIMASIALYRPGPMDFIPSYCRRKKGIEEVDFFHPQIEKYVKHILEKTYGYYIYQEQLMDACCSLANFTLVDGYDLIKGVGKKKKEIIDKYKNQFINSTDFNKISKDVLDEYWERYIIPFANYGFNMAHSGSYGLTSYCTAYLKTYYPEEFMTSTLNTFNDLKDFDKVDKIKKELTRLDIEIGSKNINTCKVGFSLTQKKDLSKGINKSIISPSLMCKGLGMATAEVIAKNAPYKDLKDFTIRTQPSLSKDAFECLIEDGFFNEYMKKYNKVNKGNKLDKESLVKMFLSIREDSKKMSQKQIVSQNVFDLA